MVETLVMSNYYLSVQGYGFKNIGSLEEYISYDIKEYYKSLQMDLPVLYYDGQNNPPHPKIWIKYYLKVFSLYASEVLSIAQCETKDNMNERLSHLSNKAKTFLNYLRKNKIDTFTPIEMSLKMKVTNKTIINWCIELSNNGFLKPIIVNKRIRNYRLI